MPLVAALLAVIMAPAGASADSTTLGGTYVPPGSVQDVYVWQGQFPCGTDTLEAWVTLALPARTMVKAQWSFDGSGSRGSFYIGNPTNEAKTVAFGPGQVPALTLAPVLASDTRGALHLQSSTDYGYSGDAFKVTAARVVASGDWSAGYCTGATEPPLRTPTAPPAGGPAGTPKPQPTDSLPPYPSGATTPQPGTPSPSPSSSSDPYLVCDVVAGTLLCHLESPPAASPSPTATPPPDCDQWRPWKVRDPYSGEDLDFYRLELCGFSVSNSVGTSSYGTSALIRTYTGIPFGGAETGITVYERYGDYRDTVTTTGGGASLRWYVVGGPTAISTPGSTWEKPGSATTSYVRSSARSAWTNSSGELRLGCLTSACSIAGFSSDGYAAGGGELYVGPSIGGSLYPWNQYNYDPEPSPSPSPSASPSPPPADFTPGPYGTQPPSAPPVPVAPDGVGGTIGGVAQPGEGAYSYASECVIQYPKAGQVEYVGQDRVCSPPGDALDIGGWLAWLGCWLGSMIDWGINVVFFLWNSLVDLLVPSNCMIENVQGFWEWVMANTPLGDVAGLVEGIGAMAENLGASSPPLTLEIAGQTVTVPIQDAVDAIAPYRGIMVFALALSFGVKLIDDALSLVGRSRGSAIASEAGFK